MSDKIIVGLFKGRVRLTSWLYDSLFPLNTICSQYFWSWRGDEMSLFCPLCANMFVAKSGWLPGAQAAGAWFFPAWLLLISFIPCCVCVCARVWVCVCLCVKAGRWLQPDLNDIWTSCSAPIQTLNKSFRDRKMTLFILNWWALKRNAAGIFQIDSTFSNHLNKIKTVP